MHSHGHKGSPCSIAYVFRKQHRMLIDMDGVCGASGLGTQRNLTNPDYGCYKKSYLRLIATTYQQNRNRNEKNKPANIRYSCSIKSMYVESPREQLNIIIRYFYLLSPVITSRIPQLSQKKTRNSKNRLQNVGNPFWLLFVTCHMRVF